MLRNASEEISADVKKHFDLHFTNTLPLILATKRPDPASYSKVAEYVKALSTHLAMYDDLFLLIEDEMKLYKQHIQIVDTTYKNNIASLAQIKGFDEVGGHLRFVHSLAMDKLNNCPREGYDNLKMRLLYIEKENRTAIIQREKSEAYFNNPQKFNEILVEFTNKAEKLQSNSKSSFFLKSAYINAYKEAKTLISILKDSYDKYFTQGNITKEEFKTKCNAAFSPDKTEHLRKHRGFKMLYSWLIKKLEQYWPNLFSVPKTDSQQKLEHLHNSLEEYFKPAQRP